MERGHEEDEGNPLQKPIFSTEDEGNPLQKPIFSTLRNECVLALVGLLYRELGNASFFKDNPDQATNNITFYDFLHKIHKRGKREEEKLRKRRGVEESSEVGSTNNDSGTRHLNNLNDNKDILERVSFVNVLDGSYERSEQVYDVLKNLDVMFLHNILINKIICFSFPNDVVKAIGEIGEVRNCAYHHGQEVKRQHAIKNLQILIQATSVLYKYLHLSTCNLEKKLTEVHKPVLDELREDVHSTYNWPIHYTLPTVVTTGAQHAPPIHDLANFVLEQKMNNIRRGQPILLCGTQGSGKTTHLKSLCYHFCKNYEKFPSPFSLVLYLDSTDRIWVGSHSSLWSEIKKILCNLASNTIEKYGIDIVMGALKTFAHNILFLLNWNMETPMKFVGEMQSGTWIVPYQGIHEPSSLCHVVRILPLTENQIIQIFQGLNPDDEQLTVILNLYTQCPYKGLITSPDMACIFNDIRTCEPFNRLLQIYVNKKVANIHNAENDIKKLGRAAFFMIRKNGKYYKPKDLQGICVEIIDKFLMTHHKHGKTFTVKVIEDYLASRFVVSNPKKCCRIWLSQTPLFKRVFRFTVSLWSENVKSLSTNISFVEKFLLEFLAVESESLDMESEAMDVDNQEDSGLCIKNRFTKWSYIISLAKSCDFSKGVVNVLGSILSKKDCWIFKCKNINDEKLRAVECILLEVERTKPIIVRLESGSDVTTLKKLLDLLLDLPGLHNGVRVQITIMHKINPGTTVARSLLDLSRKIASIQKKNFFITKYVGPFMCSESLAFSSCLAMKEVEVLDVTLYDFQSLKEITKFDCLPSLIDVIVHANLDADNQNSDRFREWSVPRSTPFTLTINYFPKLEELLNKLKNPHDLRSLSIHDLFIGPHFQFDLMSFKGLESLYVRCKSITASETNVSSRSNPEAMDTDDTSSFVVMPIESWAFSLTMGLKLPMNLQRLLLRNMSCCIDSNIFLFLRHWRSFNIQRLIILDSKLSVVGVRNILKSHIHDSNECNSDSLDSKDCNIDSLNQEFKKQCIGSYEAFPCLKECYLSKPRYTKDERDKRRKAKPNGKELIITSELGLCSHCKRFPCVCPPKDGEDSRESEDLVDLIQDAYRYNILNFSYSSRIITVRKDSCGDLRVHCPVTHLTDDIVANLEGSNPWLQRLFKTLTLVQNICLESTDLTTKGAMKVIDILRREKTSLDGTVEPFALTITTTYHPKFEDEIMNSRFIHFLKTEACLVQMNFWCHCNNRCNRIKRSRDGDIFVNDKRIHRTERAQRNRT